MASWFVVHLIKTRLIVWIKHVECLKIVYSLKNFASILLKINLMV